MNDAIDIINNLGIKINKSEDGNNKELGSWLGESILDIEKKELNPNLWNGKELKDSVRKQIIDSINVALKNANINKDRMTKAVIEGSNLTYYYNNYTDVDIHLFIEDITEDEAESLKSEIDILNKAQIFIRGTKNVLEFYRMDEEQSKRSAGPKYDLVKNKWVKDPTRIDMPKERYLAAVEIALTFARDLDLALGEIKRDIIGYIALDDEIEEILNIDLEQFRDNKKIKLQEIKADLEALVTKQNIIKDMRRKAHSVEFEPNEETLYYFKESELDRSYTLYNMVFKVLQRFGYVDPLKMLKYDIYDKALKERDFDQNPKKYIKEIIGVLNLFNEIDKSRI